jgi:hypothetical protein
MQPGPWSRGRKAHSRTAGDRAGGRFGKVIASRERGPGYKPQKNFKFYMQNSCNMVKFTIFFLVGGGPQLVEAPGPWPLWPMPKSGPVSLLRIVGSKVANVVGGPCIVRF